MKYTAKFTKGLSNILVRKTKILFMQEATVSFTFDDVPNSAFSTGRFILAKYNFQATYYISMGIKDDNNPDKPYFDRSYLREVVSEGGELACHTYSHLHLYSTSEANLIADLKKNKKAIEDIIPGYRFYNFSYPYGEHTFEAKKVLYRRFNCARTVNEGINISPVDLLSLKAVLLGGRNTLDYVKTCIDEAIEKKGWLIFFTHDVNENPSEWGCTPGYLEKVAEYCTVKNINVKTVDKAIRSFWKL